MLSIQTRSISRSKSLALAAAALLSLTLHAPHAVQADEPEVAPSAPVDDDIQQQRSNRDLHVVAKSLKLTRTARERLTAIAARYRAATGKMLTITGGDRDAEGQARLMYMKLGNGEDLIKIYARRDLVRPVVSAYEAGKSDGKRERAILSAMTRIIEAQMLEGQYISRHLQFTGADVRSRDMTDEQVEAFRAAVQAEPGVQLVDERESVSPHLHLSL